LYFPFISSPVKEGGGEKKEVLPLGKGESKKVGWEIPSFPPPSQREGGGKRRGIGRNIIILQKIWLLI